MPDPFTRDSSGGGPATGAATAPAIETSLYMDAANRQFGTWRLDETARSSPIKASLFFPDRRKDERQYADKPAVAAGHYGESQIKSIHFCGDFQSRLGQQNWSPVAANAMQRVAHPKGWVWTCTTGELPAGFYDYKYRVEFENGQVRWVSDPCARYGGKDVKNQNSGFVIGPRHVRNTQPLPGRKPLRDLVVYELNIDDFTDEFRYTSDIPGTHAALDAVRSKLDYLVKLGVTAILFLPWTAWASDFFNWGYVPYQYFSVEHRYTEDVTDTSPNHESRQLSRLRHLINECHARDIHVLMDGVFNHVGPDTSPTYSGFAYRWLYQDPEASPYVGTFGGTFPGLKDLDYNNYCTQQFIRDVCFYWMDEFQIDGIRFDNTVNYYIAGEQRGLPQLLADLETHAKDPNFSLTIEHIDLSAASVTNDTAATSYWNNGLYGCAFQYLWDGKIGPRLLRVLDSHAGLKPEKIATVYCGNHDHAQIGWQAGARDDCGSMQWYRTQPYAIALFTAPGTPMITNGQEFGEDHWIPEDDHGTNRRVQPRALRWEFVDDPIGSKLFDLYRRLIQIRKAHGGLRSDNFYPAAWEEWQTKFNPQGYGIDVDKQVLIYHRWGEDSGQLQRFMVVLNFSPQDQSVDVPFPANGLWTDLLNEGVTVSVNDFWLRNRQVNAYWGNIFCKQE